MSARYNDLDNFAIRNNLDPLEVKQQYHSGQIRNTAVFTGAVGSLFIPGPEDIILGAGVLKWVVGLFKTKRAVKTTVKTTEKVKDATKTVDDVTDVKKMDDLIEDAKPGRRTKGKIKQYEKEGGVDQANKDFDDLNPNDVKEIDTNYGTGRAGTLEDGTKVTVRPGSSDGRPTLETRNPDNGRGNKIRYNEKQG